LTEERRIEVAARIEALKAEAESCQESDFLGKTTEKPYSDTAISAEGKSNNSETLYLALNRL